MLTAKPDLERRAAAGAGLAAPPDPATHDARVAAGLAGGEAMPRHVAIIMDGNGRWAKARFLPRVAGHRQGAEAMRATVKACRELGVRYLTLFAFSTDNWKRPKDEVDFLMGLLRHYVRQELAELHAHGVRVRVIGGRERLARDIVTLIADAEARTRDNDAMDLIIALNYGGQDDMVQAAKRLAEDVAAGRLRPEDVDHDALSSRLETSGIPDPDLVIRTSGEKRLSNFLLWQAAYAELVFVATAWPDFGKADLVAALDEFQRRQRRYGGLCE